MASDTPSGLEHSVRGDAETRARCSQGGEPELDILTLGTEAAMARGRWRLKMPDGKELSGMTSIIFRKLPEGWRIVHDHSSTESS